MAEHFSSPLERVFVDGRGLSRVLKVARTIADLAGDKAVKDSHLAEALAYREVFL